MKYTYCIYSDWGTGPGSNRTLLSGPSDVEPTAEQYERAAWDSGQENALWIERTDENGIVEAVQSYDPNAAEGEKVGWQNID